MKDTDRAPIVAIAMLAARADGDLDDAERRAIDEFVVRIGAPDVSRLADQVATGGVRAADVAAKLSSREAKRLAYETALAVCHSDGTANEAERAFLDGLREALGFSVADVADCERTAQALAGSLLGGETFAGAAPRAEVTAGAEVKSGTPPRSKVDDLILQQAMLTGALEILPDRLANIAVLPLQLKLVYQIGQQHGQKLDLDQVKDLAAALGIGAVAQGLEGTVMKVFGGVAGGLLGGMVGGAARAATGVAITFATSYALGHVADRYYTKGRQLSRADLQALFTQFQADAKGIFPRVQKQIEDLSKTLNLQSLLGGLRA